MPYVGHAGATFVADNGQMDTFTALVLLMTIAAPMTIEDVDFANYTFHDFADLESIPMKDGEYCTPPDQDTCVFAGEPVFGDLTGDGVAEAAISLSSIFRHGNGSHSMGFVYTMTDGKPRLIGRFAGGDRANGGILNFHIRKQRLVVLRMQGSCPSCMDATEEDVFRWNGRRLTLVSSHIRR